MEETHQSSVTQSAEIRSSAVFLLLVVLYSVTANWAVTDQNVDTIAATLPAWHLVTEGTFDLTEYAGLNPWLTETPDGYWTNRPPGLVAVATIAHALAVPFGGAYGGGPGTAMAVVLAAGAVTLVAVEIGRLHGRQAGYLGAVALGIASATWPQSSAELFPHAIGQFLLALVIRYLVRDRLWLVGLIIGLAITVRPPVAVIALVLGVGLALRRRQIEPLLAIGVPATAGLATVVIYNRLIFGSLSISGGYGPYVDSTATYRTPSGYLSNLVGTFFDGSNGLLAWSPWIGVVVVYMMFNRRSADSDWIPVAAMAGLTYVLVHTALNRHWGGLAFNYRYSLEPLVLCMPLIAAPLATILDRRTWRLLLLGALGVSILLQASVAFLLDCVDEGGVAVCSLL